jgi:hypothetical protein
MGARAHAARLALGPHTGRVGVRVLPAEGRAPQGLRLTFEADAVGTHTGQIAVATGLLNPREATLSYSFIVEGTLEVNPNPAYFNLREPGAKSRVLDVRSRQAGFVLQKVTVSEGPFRASFARAAEPGHYRVTISVLDDQLDPETRGILGKLQISSNDRAEPVKEIPLLAFGKPNRAE